MEASSALRGPSDDRSRILPPGSFRPVAGGGLAAILSGSAGLFALYQGARQLAGRLEVRSEEGELNGEVTTSAGPGTWLRTIRLRSGAVLEERGLLPDIYPAAVVQWRWLPAPTGDAASQGMTGMLALRLHLPPPHPPQDLRLLLAATTPVAVVVRPGGSDGMAASASLRSLTMRERQRVAARRENGLDLSLDLSGSASNRPLENAIFAIEESALAFGSAGRPLGPFLAGVADGIPDFLSDSQLAELGVAALATGRFGLARGVLDSLMSASDSTPRALDLMATMWTAWTGRPAPSGTARGGVRGSRVRPTAEIGRSLPVAGSPASARQHQALGDLHPRFPPPGDFGNPDLPAFAARRTLQAARLIRSWVEKILSVRPDAPAGRLRTAPEIQPDWVSLRVDGLRMGDAVVALECRRDGRKTTFVLRQEGGRVPIQFVFEPLLPLSRILEVRIDDTLADIGQKQEGEGVRLSCQFPLDPERRVTIVGRP